MKKVGKTTRPLRYDLNKILYHYTGSDKQIQGIKPDRVPEELWMQVCDIVQETVIKNIPNKNKYKEAKWLSEEALTQLRKKEKLKEKEKRKDKPI